MRSRGGLQIVPDRIAAGGVDDGVRLPALREQAPVLALDEALQGIAARYGERTAELVAMQLELPRGRPSR